MQKHWLGSDSTNPDCKCQDKFPSNEDKLVLCRHCDEFHYTQCEKASPFTKPDIIQFRYTCKPCSSKYQRQ